jgi:hypothetical protein
MNIGDKVRLLHGKEEGIVYAFLPGNVVEIEIEDGFRIPVLKNEIVTISPVEAIRMQKNPEPVLASSQSVKPVSRQAVFADKGIFLAFVSINDKSLTVHVINNTDWTLPFTAGQLTELAYRGLAGGQLLPRTSQKLAELLVKDFDLWPTFTFDFLYFREGNASPRLPFQKKIRCRAQSFFKSKRLAPVLNKEAFLLQLDDHESSRPAEDKLPSDFSDELRSRLMNGAEPEEIEIQKPEKVIDLHIEKLTDAGSSFSKDQILKIQLDAFEKGLELALAGGMDEITFIHGVGNGFLRDELHRRLSKNQHVLYFKDAQKEKFGYGATLVKLK